MKRLSNGTLAAIIIAVALIVDQILKIWVKTSFFCGEAYEIASWFKIQFIENNGMAFGMEFGSKLLLTWFRIIAVAAFFYYLVKIRSRLDLPAGYVACIALITAGALGNVIDCIFYGIMFNSPDAPAVAQMFPPEGGYGSLFQGKVVDMFYFPICDWTWPSWLPWVGGEHFTFFSPSFNFADACLSVGVIALILCYSKQRLKDDKKKAEETVNDDKSE